MSIENRCGEIKATLQKLTDVKVSPTARLVAVLATCGITDTAEVASLVGRSVRMVQVARNELRETHCADAQPIAPDATHCAKPIAQNETHCAPRVHAPAQMEYPTGISSIEGKPVSRGARDEIELAGEIPGLNGSTSRYVDMLAGWLAGELRPKEFDTAHAILAGNVEHYGPDKVKAGMLELQAAIGAGQKPRDPGKAFSGFVKNAKPPRAGEQPKLSKADEKKAGALKLLESIRARAAAEAAA